MRALALVFAGSLLISAALAQVVNQNISATNNAEALANQKPSLLGGVGLGDDRGAHAGVGIPRPAEPTPQSLARST